MKNQNDLIAIIAAVVVLLGAVIGTWQTAPQPESPPSPETVPSGPPKFTAGEVKVGNGLPGAGDPNQILSTMNQQTGNMPAPMIGGPGL